MLEASTANLTETVYMELAFNRQLERADIHFLTSK